MLKKISEKLQQARSELPITQEQYSAWKDHPCTVQLFEDLQFASLEAGSDFDLGRGAQIVAEQGLRLAAVNEIVGRVVVWKPESLGEVAE